MYLAEVPDDAVPNLAAECDGFVTFNVSEGVVVTSYRDAGTECKRFHSGFVAIAYKVFYEFAMLRTLVFGTIIYVFF